MPGACPWACRLLCILVFVVVFHVKRYNETVKTRIFMDSKTFKTLAGAGAIESVVIFDTGDGYELWAYPTGRCESNRFLTALGKPRVWASLDTLVSYLRQLGYSGSVRLDCVRPG